VELKHEAVLFEAGAKIDRVYFPHSGIISLVIELAGGEAIEAAMIGRDSMLGATSALDGEISLNKAIIQLPGHGEALDVAHFREVAEQSPTLRTILLRHERMLFAQAQQTAACNVAHIVEARLARWLLRARDLSGSDKLELTQEFLAQMLGVRRSSVSPVGGGFVLGRKPMAKRMRTKLREIKERLMATRHDGIDGQGKWLAQVLRGWMAYYAVPMSGSAISAFRHHMIERWHGALMRRSQRRRLTWTRMKTIADRYLPFPRILHPWPEKRFLVTIQGGSPVR